MQITARNRHATASALSLPSSAQGSDTGRGMLVGGHVLSTFVALFLFFDGGARLVRFAPYVEGTVKFGYADHLASWIGLVLILSTLLYVIPRTAVLGAILLTGYLGGATASQLRADDPWFLFPVSFGVLAWGGLYLRDARLRALIPLRR
ncbi:DoxX family protein [soil metagenome]